MGDRLECFGPDSPSFSISEWNEAAIVPESDRSPEAEALRKELTHGSGLDLVIWRRITTAPEGVLFAAATGVIGGEQALAIWLVPDRAHPGDWTWTRGGALGNCLLQLAVLPDRSRADVFLDPAKLPSAANRVIHLLIRETACASGRSPSGRVLPPTVRLDATSVTVLITISKVPGPQDCQGVDPVPYDLMLPEPLGNRELLDGGQVPAATITEEPCCG